MRLKLGPVQRWLVKALGVFVPLLREVGGMLYQWDELFVISDLRFREQFQQGPMNADKAAAATVAWAQRHYAKSP